LTVRIEHGTLEAIQKSIINSLEADFNCGRLRVSFLLFIFLN
jgi:hypothetical protein